MMTEELMLSRILFVMQLQILGLTFEKLSVSVKVERSIHFNDLMQIKSSKLYYVMCV